MIEANNSNSIPNNAKQHLYRAIFTVNILSLLAGITYGYLFHEQRVIEDSHIGDIGGIIGVFIWIAVSDKFSKKVINYSICAVLILEYFFIILNPWSTVLRYLLDANMSITILCNLHYLNEITLPGQKGHAFSSVFLFAAIGNDISQLVQQNFSQLDVSFLVPLLLVLYFGMIYNYPLPESPSYLMRLGDEIGAAQSITQFRENESDVQAEIIKLREIKSEDILHKVSLLFSSKYVKSTITVAVLSIPLMHYQINMMISYYAHTELYSLIEISIMHILAFIVCISILAFIRQVNRKIGLLLFYTVPLLYHVIIIFYMDYSLYFLIYTFTLIVFYVSYIYGSVIIVSFLFCEMFPSYLLNYVWCTYLLCQNLVALAFNGLILAVTVSPDMINLIHLTTTICVMLVIVKFYYKEN